MIWKDACSWSGRHKDPGKIETQNLAFLLYRSRFAQVIGTVGFAAADEAIEVRITAYLGYFIIQPVASQHTEMAMVIGTAAAFGKCSHSDSPGKMLDC